MKLENGYQNTQTINRDDILKTFSSCQMRSEKKGLHMAKIKKIGNYTYRKGRPHPWTVQISLGNQRIAKSFTNKQDAEKWAYTQHMKHLKSFDFQQSLTTFPEFFSYFMKEEKAGYVSNATFRNYVQTQKVITTLYRGLRLRDCTTATMQPPLDEYSVTHSAKTVTEHLKRIRAALRYALEINAIDVNCGPRLKQTGYELDSKRNQSLSMEDFKKLRKQLLLNHDTKFKVLTLLATETGARRGELLALTKKDLLSHSHSISITKSKSPTDDSLKLKTRGSKRIIDISERVFTIVSNLEVEPDGYIFPTDSFKQSSMLKDLLQQLKIPNTTFHGLRDSHASFLFASFNDDVENAMLYVSKRLGHADLLTTQRYYVELMPEKKHMQNAQALNFLSEAL